MVIPPGAVRDTTGFEARKDGHIGILGLDGVKEHGEAVCQVAGRSAVQAVLVPNL